MKRALTFIFGLILMVAPFVPTPSIADAPSTVTVIGTILAPEYAGDPATPLGSAAISIPETTTGTNSLPDGTFKLSNIPSNAKLQISFLGYKTKEINLSDHTPTDNTIDLGNITLESDTQVSEEVIVTENSLGYAKCNTDLIATGLKHTTRECFPCKCNDGYTLMTKNKRNPTLTYQQRTDTSNPWSPKTKTGQDICPNSPLFTGNNDAPERVQNTEDIYNQLSDMQCIATTNCARGTGVSSSQYVLQDDNTFKCIAECHGGYTPDPNDASKCQSVDDCTSTAQATDPNVARAEYTGSGANRKCVVKECKCGYDVNGDKTGCTTWDAYKCSSNTKIRGATRMQRFCDGETEVCTALECDTENYKKTELTDHDYNLPTNISKLYICEEHAKQCTPEQRTANALNLQNASKSKPIIDITKNDGSQICIPTKCVCGYDLTNPDSPNAKCTKWGEDDLCPTKPKNAADNQYFRRCRGKNNDQEYCYINDCTDGYLPNEDHDRCVLDRKSGECAPENNNNVRYAKWRKRNGKYMCIIIECVRGYEPNDAGTECVAKIVLPEEKSKARINELQGVYNKAKKNEMSDANKILGGASMGATGAGGMMLGMGLAEQKADNAAYEQMRGYVSTFKCNYGANNIEYSVEPTQLPTSTELTNLYAEYVTLANDLKMRKSALGLRAGLESQPILDSATSGLYDDVSSGRATGTFTSLARAILDPDGEDAKRWAEQTKKSKNLIIAGGVTAGVGAVGGIVGNQLINKDAITLSQVKEKIKGINGRYTRQAYSDLVTELDAAAANSGLEATVNPGGAEGEQNENAALQAITLTLSIPTSALWNSGKYTWEDIENTNNARENLGNLLSQTITALDNFITQVNTQETNEEAQITASNPVKITVTGHTDTEGKQQDNQELSLHRAETMTTKLSELTTNMTNTDLIDLEEADGKGEDECTCRIKPSDNDTPETKQIYAQYCPNGESDDKIERADAYADTPNEKIGVDYAPCRRVDITIIPPQVTNRWFDGGEQIDLQDFIEEFNPEREE